VVYYVLPRPGATGGELAAIVSQPKVDGLVIDPGPATGDTAGGGGTVFIGDGEPDPDMHPPSPAEARSRLALSEELHNGRLMSNAIPPSHDLIADAMVGRQAERVIVQVDASNLFAARTQVRDYLRENNFTITSEEAGVPEPLNLRQSQVLLGARHQQTGVRLKQAPQPATPPQPESTPGSDVAAAAQRELQSNAPSTQPAQLADVPAAGYATQSQAVSFLSSMSRKEIDAMCQRITDPMSGQIAQVIEDPAGLGRGAGLSVLLTPGTQPSGALIDADPKPMDDANPILHLNPATQPAAKVETQSISDQRVEVQIVVRGELPAETPDPTTQPSETAPITAPTTAPATEPSR
jgi:hypothetical protein